MPGRILRFFFAMTSLAPFVFVVAMGLVGLERRSYGTLIAAWIGLACLIALTRLAIVWFRRTISTEQLSVRTTKPVDREALAYLLTYALPLVGVATDDVWNRLNWWGVFGFFAVVVLVVFQLNLTHINPLLGIFGWHFFEVEAASGATYLLIAGRRVTGAQELTVRRLADDMFWEA